MKITVFLLFLSFMHIVVAKPGDEAMRTIIVDENLKPSDFPQTMKFDKKKSKMSFTREQRDEKFEKLNLTEHLDKIEADELERDVLYIALRNKNKDISEIITEYPRIPAKALTHAKANFNY